MPHPIIRQIVDRLHVSASDDDVIAEVKDCMKPGAWEKLDRKTRSQF